MNKTSLIVLSVLGLACIGLLIARQMANPKVTVQNVDWNAGTATVLVDGKPSTISRLMAVGLKGGWTVRFSESYWPGKNGTDITSIVLTHNGAIRETVQTRS